MLILDIREACREKRTGKGQWTLGLLQELLVRPMPLILVSDSDVPESIARLLRPDHQVFVFALKGIAWHRRVHRFLKEHAGAAFLSTTSYLLPAFSTAPVSFVMVVHDLIAFRPEPHDFKVRLIEQLTLKRALKRSSAVVTVSEATRTDLLQKYSWLPKNTIHTVFAGPSHRPPIVRKPDGKTILCLATLCPRKNQSNLLKAYALLPKEVRATSRLVLAGGRGWNDEGILSLVKTIPGVQWVGHVSDEEMWNLFSTCEVFAYPSLYEGFGLPVLDAFSCGIPVLTSDCGSLYEVADRAALIVDPRSVRSIADGLQQLLKSETLRASIAELGQKRSQQYSWKRTVDLLLLALPIDKIA